ncbi:DUF4179 domain-containing protein [Natranaerobius thermophilus]|uniref:Uncharacterized protein n=1 Tax=Natranaerobius thermophilus (strain ATCC BAA-1301 / DSM 18059 / JW/NM-WN-LF) TaxID=457570 RepID=B2A1W2_NATTJ|nr:DUF4179 domain-containing protein [Natranaerobius thermophilus]ACB86159.1 hypothetical protein Nther_2603 [Natranaerobius thermophilus JW/NM-WN-LF]
MVKDFEDVIKKQIKEEQDKVSVPENLDKKIIDTVESTYKRKRPLKLKKLMTKSLTAALFIIFIFAGSVNIFPGFYAYASEIPIIGAAADWFKGDRGTEHAQEMGYDEIDGFTIEQDDIKFTFENIMIDEGRMTLSLLVSGDKITELLEEQYSNDTTLPGERTEDEDRSPHIVVAVDFLDFEHGGPRISYDYDTESHQYIKARAEKNFSQGELQEFLEEDPSELNLSVSVERHSDDQEEVLTEIENLDIDFEPEDIMHSETYSIDNKAEIPHGEFHIKDLTVNPTRMKIDTETNMSDSYSIVGYDNMYLMDNEGNRYVQEGTLLSTASADKRHKKTFYFVPSLYFELEDIDELYLGFDYVQVGDDTEKHHTVRTEEIPKSIEYMDEELQIKDITQNGEVTFKIPDTLAVSSIRVNGERTGETSTKHFQDKDYTIKTFHYDTNIEDEMDINLSRVGLNLEFHDKIELPLEYPSE